MSKSQKDAIAHTHKRGERLFLSGEANPVIVLKRLDEHDTGKDIEIGRYGSGKKQWVSNWRYRVRDAKGREFVVIL